MTFAIGVAIGIVVGFCIGWIAFSFIRINPPDHSP
jgi:hypothetical protein